MKRFQFCVFACILFLPAFVFTASAHSGRTDSQGGHYDWSTGEYHYHHGYPAHDHYDMDGDGIVDCPYNFNDRTGYSSSSNYSSTSDNDGYLTSVSSYNEGYNDGYDTGYDDGYDAGYDAGNKIGYEKGKIDGYETGFEEGSDKKVPSWMLFLSLAILGILVLVNRSRRSKLREMEEMRNRDQEKMNEKDERISQLSNQLQVANQAYEDTQWQMEVVQSRTDMLLKAYQIQPVQTPGDVLFTEDGYPVLGEVTQDRPYGEYTAFLFPKGKMFHMTPNCGSSGAAKPVHLFDVLEERQPCSRCCYRMGIPKSEPQWYKDICAIRRRNR